MKKVLLAFLCTLVALPAFAIEVYNNGEDNVNIYGTIRGYIGYGYGTDHYNTTGSDMMYGVQGNSRLGVRFQVGNFSGNVEFGAAEATLWRGTGGNVGLRQAWGAYSFGSAGKLLVGKTDTPTSMVGFSSDVYNTDSGFAGFGGNNTSNRRFQIQYSVAGLTIALVEADMRGVSVGSYTYAYTNDGPLSKNATLEGNYIPRIVLAYQTNFGSTLFKVGATYSANNTNFNSTITGNNWQTVHAFGVVLGVKPTFMDGRAWLAIQARYGMNEDLYGEAGTYVSNGGFGLVGLGQLQSLDNNGDVQNVTRINGMAEFGFKVINNFALILGAGYQVTMNDADVNDIHSYGAYLQLPYTINANLAFLPEIAWYETNYDGASKRDGVLVGMQMRITF